MNIETINRSNEIIADENLDDNDNPIEIDLKFCDKNNNNSTTVSQNNGEISTSSYEYVLLIK